MTLKYRTIETDGYIYGLINLNQVQTIHFYPKDSTVHFDFGKRKEDRTWILHIEEDKFEDVQFFMEDSISHKTGMLDISEWVENLEIVETT